MNQCLYRGLAAAVLVSAVGTPLSVRAEQIDQLEALLQASGDLETASTTVTSPEDTLASEGQDEGAASDPQENTLVSGNHGEAPASVDAVDSAAEALASQAEQSVSASETEDVALGLSDLVRVIPHTLNDREVATLYVRDIPVLTFVEQASAAQQDKGLEGATPTSESRALDIARRLDEYHLASGDPTAIGVRWDAELEEYVIDLADEVLVVINEATILPDTTSDHAEDALQATNRLRRLMGGAEPLQEIEGRPEPEPAPETAVRDSWSVSSVSTGRASWYGPGFHGRRTASGEVFNQYALTAAHRTLPFGTLVRVTNLNNDRQVIVRINDRGPFSHGRILDLSAGAAREIGLDRAGVGPIRLEVLSN